MGALLVLDVGVSTGVALLHGPHIATDTVAADDLYQYLADTRDILAQQDVPLAAVVAERPLTLWRSSLSRDLAALCTITEAAFPQVRWVQPAEWKQQQQPLIAYARSHHLAAWKQTRSPHERDALLIGLFWQGVLVPAKSP